MLGCKEEKKRKLVVSICGGTVGRLGVVLGVRVVVVVDGDCGGFHHHWTTLRLRVGMGVVISGGGGD